MPQNKLPDVDLKHGVVPITKAAATLAELLRKIQESHSPVVVTQKGYPAAVILDVDSYTSLRQLAENWLEASTSHASAETLDVQREHRETD